MHIQRAVAGRTCPNALVIVLSAARPRSVFLSRAGGSARSISARTRERERQRNSSSLHILLALSVVYRICTGIVPLKKRTRKRTFSENPLRAGFYRGLTKRSGFLSFFVGGSDGSAPVRVLVCRVPATPPPPTGIKSPGSGNVDSVPVRWELLSRCRKDFDKKTACNGKCL